MPVRGEEFFEAACNIVGATGASLRARGCTTTRAAAGRYDVTLDRALDSEECIIQATPRNAATNRAVTFGFTSDTVIRFEVRDGAGAFIDNDLDVAIFRIASGNFN